MAYTISVHVDKRTAAMVTASLKNARRKLEPAVVKEIRKSAGPPLRRDIKASAAARLPQRGGLAKQVARSARTTTAAGKNVVRIRTTSAYDEVELNRGRTRHPLFGNRRHWYRQSIQPGWWTRPVEDHHDDIKRAAQRAIDEIAIMF